MTTDSSSATRADSPPSSSAEAPPAGAHGSRTFRVPWSSDFGIALVLIALVAFIGVNHPDFMASSNLMDTFRSAAFVAIIAYGMVFLLAMGEIDLSIGGIYGVAIVLSANWMADGHSPWLAAAAVLLIGVLMGAINGLLAWAFAIPVLIITIGTLSVYRGLVQILAQGKYGSGLPLESSFFELLSDKLLGFPVSGWFALVLCVILTVLFTKTRFGAMVRASGSNRAAAEYSGIAVNRIRMYALMLTGGLAALSGVLSMAYFQGSDPQAGTGLELSVIAAVIIGGTGIAGGTGSVPGALIGASLVAVINTGLVFFRIDPIWSQFVTGAVIVLAVASDAIIRRRRSRVVLT